MQSYEYLLYLHDGCPAHYGTTNGMAGQSLSQLSQTMEWQRKDLFRAEQRAQTVLSWIFM